MKYCKNHTPEELLEKVKKGKANKNIALKCFAKIGRNDLVKKLIEMGTDVKNSKALFEAAKKGRYEVVRTLIEAGANPNIKNNDGDRPIVSAIYTLSEVVAPFNKDNGHDLYFDENKHGNKNEYVYPALDEKKYLQIIEFLIKAGTNINKPNKNGYAPLHIAVNIATADVVELLLKYGANPNITNKEGVTPLHVKIAHHDHGYDFEEIIELLLEYKADVNAKTKNGNTPLHLASSFIFIEEKDNILRILLKNGADPNVQNNNGVTPLHCAAQENPQAVDLLLQYGAYPSTRDVEGNTALHYAAMINIGHCVDEKIDALRKLIEAGLDIDYGNEKGVTPLHIASNCNYVEPKFVQVLLENGADPNLTDENGRTPIFNAIDAFYSASSDDRINNAVKCIELLCQYKADMSIKDGRGKTPLIYMITHRDWKKLKASAIKILLDHGADVLEKNEEGKTALHLAIDRFNEQIVNLLTDKILQGKEYELKLKIAEEKFKDVPIYEYNLYVKDPDGDIVYRKTFYSFDEERVGYTKPSETKLSGYEQVAILYKLFDSHTVRAMSSRYALDIVGVFAYKEINYILRELQKK